MAQFPGYKVPGYPKSKNNYLHRKSNYQPPKDIVDLTKKIIPIINQVLKTANQPRTIIYSKNKCQVLNALTKEYDILRITKIINWYSKHYNWKFAPKIFSVKDFSNRLPNLELSMSRWNENHPQIKVSKKIHKLSIERYAMVPKNGRSKRFIKLFNMGLQITNDNFQKFSNMIHADPELEFCYEYAPHPYDQMIEWWDQLGNWIDKSRIRNPLKLVFDPKDKKGQRWIRNWCDYFNYSPHSKRKIMQNALQIK